MSRKDDQGRTLCTAETQAGKPCRGPAIKGAPVCKMHGGSLSVVKEAAHRRIIEGYLEPSALALVELIKDQATPPAVRLNAIRTVWEFAGEKPPTEITLSEIIPLLPRLIEEADALEAGDG